MAGIPTEYRFAVSMNGGVSLAVWISGVAHELYELSRSNRPGQRTTVYDGLLGLVDATVSIDVLSGSSAGGINAGLLGVGLATDADSLGPARQLWLKEGDVEELLRSVDEKEPISLLDGAGFLEALVDGLSAVRGTGTADPNRRLVVLLTGSQLKGTTRRLPDSTGADVIDTDFAAVFRFDGVHLASENRIGHLAIAARASASFPVAFEPVWVSLTGGGGRPDMSDHLVGSKPTDLDGMWVVDGGTLNNKPIDLAIEAVFAQPARGQVIRKLAYVVPDPGADDRTNRVEPPKTTAPQPAEDNPVPGLLKTAVSALFTLPRNESIRSEINQIAAHNDEVARLRDARLHIAAAVGGDDLVSVAAKFEDAYRARQSRESATRTTNRVIAHLRERRKWDEVQQRVTPAQLTKALAGPRADHIPVPYLPTTVSPQVHGEKLPGNQRVPHPDGVSDPVDSYWGYGITTAKRLAGIVVDIIQSTLADVPAANLDPVTAEQVETLAQAQSEVHAALQVMLTQPATRWDEWIAECAERLTASGVDDLDKWAADFYNNWGFGEKPAEFQRVGAAAAVCAEQLRVIAPAVVSLASREFPGQSDEASERLKLIRVAVQGLTTRTKQSPIDDVAWTLRQLLALELVHFSNSDHSLVDQPLDLVQVSAYATNYLSDHNRAEQKVTGIAAGHFAAFYKSSWRANDWMWGRLDGASRLVDTLVEPHRLRQLWFGDRDGLMSALERAATDSLDPVIHEHLHAEWAQMASTEAFQVEVEQICTATTDVDRPLAVIRSAVARRIQLEIMMDELPGVARAVRSDRDDGNQLSTSASQFLGIAADAFDMPSLLNNEADEENDGGNGAGSLGSVAAALEAFKDCRIGEERILGETGADRLTQLTGRTAVVSTSAFRDILPYKSVKRGLGVVRGVGLLLYLLTGLVSTRKPGGLPQLVHLLTFAAGAGGLGVIITADNLGLVASLVCLGLIAAPLISAGTRLGIPSMARKLTATVAGALACWNIDRVLDVVGVDPTDDTVRTGWSGSLVTHKELLSIGVLLVGFMFLGAVSLRPRTE